MVRLVEFINQAALLPFGQNKNTCNVHKTENRENRDFLFRGNSVNDANFTTKNK